MIVQNAVAYVIGDRLVVCPVQIAKNGLRLTGAATYNNAYVQGELAKAVLEALKLSLQEWEGDLDRRSLPKFFLQVVGCRSMKKFYNQAFEIDIKSEDGQNLVIEPSRRVSSGGFTGSSLSRSCSIGNIPGLEKEILRAFDIARSLEIVKG